MKAVKLKYCVVAAALALFMVPGAYAVPLTLDDVGVAGIVEPGTENSNVANELAWANYLLGLGANTSVAYDANGDGNAEDYTTGANDYNGTLSGGTQIQGGANDVSGFEWVLAKYDGKNAGYVLFNVADYGTTIPSTSEDLWVNKRGNGYGLSHFTGFGDRPPNGVPDAGSTLGLLGLTLIGMGLIRRKAR
jgi:hypothetical protein